MRRLFAAAVLAVATLIAPLAAPNAALAAPATAPGSAPADAPADASIAYLDQLLQEINARRARAGNAPVVYITPDANSAVAQYLADLTPRMEAVHSCFHGQNNPVAPSWDYVKAAGLDSRAHGEVLACPGDNGFWTAPKIADGWWNSPSHFQALYGDRTANAVACGTYGPQNNGRAFETIACVTYHI